MWNRLFLAFLLITGTAHAETILFSDNFESGLWLWKQPPASATVTTDPLGSGSHVLTFGAGSTTGDIFSVFSIPTSGYSSVVVRFDYLGKPVTGSTPNNYGGFVGITTNYTISQGKATWIAGTLSSAANGLGFQGIDPIDDSAWHSYQIDITSLLKNNSISSLYLMLEDWKDAGGVNQGKSGDVFFDNISVIANPVPEPETYWLIFGGTSILVVLKWRNKTVLLTLGFTFAILGESNARICETIDQCIERYGKPVFIDGSYYEFKKDPYLILATFGDYKRCKSITFYKLKSNGKPGEDFSPSEVTALLKLNSWNFEWMGLQIPNFWRTSGDGILLASYDPYNQRVMISDTRTFAADKEKEKQDAAQTLKGF